MAVSIAQAQKSFLSSGGFVGGMIRTDPAELSEVEKELAKYISTFLTKASDNLNKSNSTGELDRSLNYNLVSSRTGYVVEFTANDYYDYVDKGVRGVKGGKNSTSPYSFKFINPSKSHVQAIKKWMSDNRLTAMVNDIGRYGSTIREKKGVNSPADQAAWIVARSTKIKGIAPTNFWTKAFQETFADFDQKISASLGRTIEVTFKQMGKEVKK